MPRPTLHDCPACISDAEVTDLVGYVWINCTRIGCSLSTDAQPTYVDALEEWDERCRIYPKPLPNDWKNLP